MNKFEFTGETMERLGITLRRIRAVRDFRDVHSGDIGGWIENEENLDQTGDAWVSDNAWVYGNARVYGDARVYGNAWVYGDAWVHGGEWENSPLYIQGSIWPFNISSPETIRCGCQDHTWQEWHDHYREISAEHDADGVLEEYIKYFNLACELYGHEDCKILLEEHK